MSAVDLTEIVRPGDLKIDLPDELVDKIEEASVITSDLKNHLSSSGSLGGIYANNYQALIGSALAGSTENFKRYMTKVPAVEYRSEGSEKDDRIFYNILSSIDEKQANISDLLDDIENYKIKIVKDHYVDSTDYQAPLELDENLAEVSSLTVKGENYNSYRIEDMLKLDSNWVSVLAYLNSFILRNNGLKMEFISKMMNIGNLTVKFLQGASRSYGGATWSAEAPVRDFRGVNSALTESNDSYRKERVILDSSSRLDKFLFSKSARDNSYYLYSPGSYTLKGFTIGSIDPYLIEMYSEGGSTRMSSRLYDSFIDLDKNTDSSLSYLDVKTQSFGYQTMFYPTSPILERLSFNNLFKRNVLFFDLQYVSEEMISNIYKRMTGQKSLVKLAEDCRHLKFERGSDFSVKDWDLIDYEVKVNGYFGSFDFKKHEEKPRYIGLMSENKETIFTRIL